MIVISGALVLVALVLLVIGVASPELNFVYASIVVSLASGVFLLVGILQRRRTAAPAETTEGTSGKVGSAKDGDGDVIAPVTTAPVTTALPAASSRPSRAGEPAGGSVAVATAEPEAPAERELPEDEDDELAGYVLVVPGRPRYHVDGCRYIAGKDVEELDVRDARDEGFTPCGVCRPDEALEDDYDDEEPRPPEPAVAGLQPMAEQEYDDQDEQEYDDDEYDELDAADVPVVEPEPVAVPVKRPASRTPAAAAPATAAPARTPARSAATSAGTAGTAVAPARQPARQAAPQPARQPAPAPAPTPARRPPSRAPSRGGASVRIPAEPAPASVNGSAATASSPTAGGPVVVVIPDRGTFHKTGCRYVRGAEGAFELSRDEADDEGYDACGVCRP